MDVRLPDGRILKNVPEGTTKAEIAQKLGLSQGEGYRTRPDGVLEIGVTPTQKPAPQTDSGQIARDTFKEMPWYEQALVGAGAGIKGAGLGIAQLLTDDDSRIGKAVQSEIDEQRPYMDATFSTPAGIAGNVSPYIAGGALLPVTGAKGAAAIGAGFGAIQPTATGENPLVPVALGAMGGAAAQKAAGAIGAKLGGKASQSAAPTVEALRKQSQRLYDAAKNQGVTINGSSFGRMVGEVEKDLIDKGIDPTINPKATAALGRLKQAAESGDIGWQQLDNLRQIAGRVASQGGDEAFLAGRILSRLDDFVGNITPADVTSGNARAAANLTTQARELWKRKSKAETIANIFERVQNKVGANYTSAGEQTALRQEFRSLANNKKLFNRFNDVEKKAILEIVRGTNTENALRMLGKFAPRGVVSSGVLMGTTAVNPALGAGLWAAGETAKKASTNMATRRVNALDEMVRAGAPVTNKLQSTRIGGASAGGGAESMQSTRPASARLTETKPVPQLPNRPAQPLPSPAPQTGGVSDDLFNRVIQQESGGNQSAVSNKGAIGVAQVMPSTGPEAARLAGVKWDPKRFKEDEEYNASLGRAYLDKQLEDFGLESLALAAYNAGPNKVRVWLKKYGDPRQGEISEEEFVSRIPFSETRTYVGRILGS